MDKAQTYSGIRQVEISSFDLRYEHCRLKSNVTEKALLSSILDHGIRDPLRGVETKGGCRILLDGFKRYRCAKKLSIGIVPYHCLGEDEAFGIITLLRIANAKSLSILEQARLIDELNTIHKMSVSQIAGLLEKSKGWVGMRVGIIGQMSPAILDKVFSGQFPVYSYMYTIRSFIRMNGISKQDVDDFVRSVSGKGLSIREIEILANGYFKGGEGIRQQIRNGNITWGLSRLKETAVTTDCTQVEQRMLKDLEVTQKYMQRVINKRKDERYKTASFNAQANLLTGGIMRQINIFFQSVKELHDKSGQTSGDLSST
ncbi:ParB/RepB/Spo0J family partition protein [Thermodesulfobacteriota bacterium]